MVNARLKSEFWVQACVRRANLTGGIATVVARGEAESGTILLKINRLEKGCEVLAETRDAAGDRAWYRGTGSAPVDEATADAYLSRARQRDPDLWVVEIEARGEELPFSESILDS